MSAPEFIPGVHDGMDAEDYHALAALSSSGIKKLLRSPAHYLVERTKATPPTESMRIGTAIHTLVLEPDRSWEVVAMPEFNARTKDGRAERDAWLAAHPGVQAFDAETLQNIHDAVGAVRSHPGASELLSDGTAERSVLWRDSAEQVECRARFDWHRADTAIVDLKSCADASPEAASRAIGSFQYHVSAAHYWIGHEHVFDASPAFWAFVFVETAPPFGVACYVLDAASLRAGMTLCGRAYKTFRQCVESGRWPGYADEIATISAPRWALREVY